MGLKPLLPTLVEAMERQGHLDLAEDVRYGLLSMSAATIDRALRGVRGEQQAGGRRRRRPAATSSVRRSIVFTRCRPWRKNDQAFVEQKNGAVVRHMVGYRRPEGPEAVAVLSRLYATARLFVNIFQPSFKLAGKTRDGARVPSYLAVPCSGKELKSALCRI